MADIRINALATTAASTASDDFVAVHGSANGTRKLNAYSPTFGGNLTVNGTATATNFIPSSGAAASGSIGGSSVYGLEIWGKTGSFSDLIIYNGAGNTLLTNLTGTQNISLAGNLTVSGTGTSSVAGSLGIATTSPNKSSFSTAVTVNGATNSGFEVAVGDTRIAGFYAASSAAVLNAFANVPLYFSTNNTTQMTLTSGGNLGIGTTDIQGKLHVRGSQADPLLRLGYEVAGQSYLDFLRTSVDAVPVIQSGYGVDGSFALAINPSGGNVLIGTTTDGGQKLQVSGTSNFSNPGSSTIANFTNSANADFQIVLTASTSAKIGPSTPTSLILQTNGTTALTLDSSQNATFAGNTTAKGTTHYFGADNSQRIELTSNNGSSQGLVEFYNRGTSAYFAARYLASSHTFEQGPIAINNTVQTAAAVASTHKVTISIGGTTYYLLATNV